ncbi:TetR/AcrR family transcriptional regulator [Pseudactinotalea sp. HY160]|uniref:TetR/AcrR family transcriptional regulator n=1 Tax=Pseudactinotalea sp. HY160 TaxID=2654490 RepID=UPI00351B46D0
MSEARDRLLSTVVDEIAEHGMAGRSLRELAGAVGTSHRMLLYHFGSREGLVAAISAEVDERERALLAGLVAGADGPADLVRGLWVRVSSPQWRPYVRLYFESLSSSARYPSAEDDPTAPWLEAGARAAEAGGWTIGADDLRLAVAVVRGLLVDVLATGETAAATAALERFLRLWDPPSAG